MKRSGLIQLEVGYPFFMSCYKLSKFDSSFTALLKHSDFMHTYRLFVGCSEPTGVFQAEWVFAKLIWVIWSDWGTSSLTGHLSVWVIATR